MGNKNSHLKDDELSDRLNLFKYIKQFINEDKTSYNYIADLRKDNINLFIGNKNSIQEKSNLNEFINSKGLAELNFELFSSLVSTGINHEVNSTLYKAVTIPKLSDANLSSVNAFDLELLGNQSALLIDWIHKTFYSDKETYYENWVPLTEKLENYALDNLEEDYSSIQKDDDDEEYSDILDKNELSFEKEAVGNKYPNKKNSVNSVINPKVIGKTKVKVNLNSNLNIHSKKKVIPIPGNSHEHKNSYHFIPKVSTSSNVVAGTQITNMRSISISHPIKMKKIKSNNDLKVVTIVPITKKSQVIDRIDSDQKTVHSILSVMNKAPNSIMISQPKNSEKTEKEKVKEKGEEIINEKTNTNGIAITIAKNKNVASDKKSFSGPNQYTNVNGNVSGIQNINNILNNNLKGEIKHELELSPIKIDLRIVKPFLEIPENKIFQTHTFKPTEVKSRKYSEELNFSNNNHNLNNLKEPTAVLNNKVSTDKLVIKSPKLPIYQNLKNNLKGDSEVNEIKLDKKNSTKSPNIGNKNRLASTVSQQTYSAYASNANLKSKQSLNKEDKVIDKEINFADLILQSVSPLKISNLKKITSPEKIFFETIDDEDIKMIKKAYIKNNYTIRNRNRDTKSPIIKGGKNVSKTKIKQRIKIDVRTLLNDLEFEKNDSSKSSTIVNFNEKSNTRELSQMRQTANNSYKYIPNFERNGPKKLTPTFIKQKSSNELKKILKEEEVGGQMILSPENNVNLNIQINSNNVNNYNTYSNSAYSMMTNDRRSLKSTLNGINVKKRGSVGSSVKNNGFNKFGINNVKGTPFVPRNELIDFVSNLDMPKFDLDLSPLDLHTLPYEEVLRLLKENNKFLFEVTSEEKRLNEQIKTFKNGEKLIEN